MTDILDDPNVPAKQGRAKETAGSVTAAKITALLKAAKFFLDCNRSLGDEAKAFLAGQVLTKSGIELPLIVAESRYFSANEAAEALGVSAWHMARDARYKALMNQPALGTNRVFEDKAGGQRSTWVWYEAGLEALRSAFSDGEVVSIN